MAQFDILVAGEINPDLILSGDVAPAFGQVEKLVDSADLAIGSSSAIFACGAARLGLKVAMIGVCGEDVWGRFMLEALAERQVDVSNVIVAPGQRTGLSVILARRTDRAILTYAGATSALQAGQVGDDLLRQARHLHVGSYFLQTALQPGLADLFRRAHAARLTTSLDTNWDPAGLWRGVEGLLPQTDVFLPNENELLAITPAVDVEAALRLAGRSAGTVAVKCGAQGALALRGEALARLPALPVEPVDTVGAGDTFDAGFLYGFLHGWNLEDCLRLAIACGSLSTRAAGGTAAQPTLAEAMYHAGISA
jgi:sugar/nucleoside kinase (ribokinase family)